VLSANAIVMPVLCRAERLVCKSGTAECALTVTQLVADSAPHATVETINAEGLAFRVHGPDPADQTIPLYITRAGRVVVNAGGLPADDSPDIEDSNMRVFGVVHADAYLNLPRTVGDVTHHADGSVTVTFTDGTTVHSPSPFASALADMQARISALEEQAPP
jgi:hypothetical protein